MPSKWRFPIASNDQPSQVATVFEAAWGANPGGNLNWRTRAAVDAHALASTTGIQRRAWSRPGYAPMSDSQIPTDFPTISIIWRAVEALIPTPFQVPSDFQSEPVSRRFTALNLIGPPT